MPTFNLLAAAPAAAATGVRTAIDLVRTKNPYLLGAVAWWGFDIAVLWACFHAFGAAPAVSVLVLAYFVGMLANTLPLPGGIGGVDGGMIGALVAFGVDPSLAVLSVLAYRGFAFWLPIAPGALAWVSLRRTVAGWEAERPEPALRHPRVRRSFGAIQPREQPCTPACAPTGWALERSGT